MAKTTTKSRYGTFHTGDNTKAGQARRNSQNFETYVARNTGVRGQAKQKTYATNPNASKSEQRNTTLRNKSINATNKYIDSSRKTSSNFTLGNVVKTSAKKVASDLYTSAYKKSLKKGK